MPEPTEAWGTGPALTEEERARVLARFSYMRGRSIELAFTFPFGWVEARNPKELEEAVRKKLAAELADKSVN